MGKLIDLAGQRFGRLVVLERVGTNKSGNVLWSCLCDCGNRIIARSDHLKDNHIQSCGCLQKEIASKSCIENKTTHNMSKTKIYGAWGNMRKRCYNIKNKEYKNYGGRGINICDEWNNEKTGLINFYNWSMANGYKEDLTIDRKDVNGNYEPSNCRWATYKEQANNKRNNHYITYKNETNTVTEWSEKLGIKRKTLDWRIANGWTTEKLFKQVRNK